MKIPINLDTFKANFIQERCGVIVCNKQNELIIVELPNRAEKPTNDFKIWEKDILDYVLLSDYKIEAVFHTHNGKQPNTPSINDLVGLPENTYGIMYHTHYRNLFWYDKTGITLMIDNW